MFCEPLQTLLRQFRFDAKFMVVFFFKYFQQDCPNGRLTPAKFVDMYKMFFPSGNAEEFCDHVFRTFDMDKNGYIDFKVSALFLYKLITWCELTCKISNYTIIPVRTSRGLFCVYAKKLLKRKTSIFTEQI